VIDTPLEELLAAWLMSAATEVASAQGDGSLFETYARHFLRFFETTARICDEVAIEQYKEHRLGQVQATTLRGELSALRRLHRWMKKRKLLSALPEVPKVPKRATGTTHKLGKRKVVKLSPEEMDAIIAGGSTCSRHQRAPRQQGQHLRLPSWSRDGMGQDGQSDRHRLPDGPQARDHDEGVLALQSRGGSVGVISHQFLHQSW
jgi:hypothetical protein